MLAEARIISGAFCLESPSNVTVSLRSERDQWVDVGLIAGDQGSWLCDISAFSFPICKRGFDFKGLFWLWNFQVSIALKSSLNLSGNHSWPLQFSFRIQQADICWYASPLMTVYSDLALTFRVWCTWIYLGEDVSLPEWILVHSLVQYIFILYLCAML